MVIQKLPGLVSGGNAGGLKLAVEPLANKIKNTAATSKFNKTPNATATPNKTATPNLPSLPQIEPFQFNYDYLNFDTAKQRAEDRYNPLFEQAVGNVKQQQYQNELNSGNSSAVRGLAHSGLAQDQLNKIAIASQGQIAGLNAQKMSDVADYAQGLLDRDQDRGDRLRAQAFNEYSSNRDYNRSVFESDRGYNRDVFESDRGYDYQVGRDKINDTRYADETKYNRSQDAIRNSQWDKQFGADEKQRGIDNAFREKDWSQLGGAEKARAAMDYLYASKLKKLKGADGGGPGGSAPGVLGQNPGAFPDDILDAVMRALQGNNYSAISNYGRGNGSVQNSNSPEGKKPKPLGY